MNRFQVIEYSSFFAIRDSHTGEEMPMGDGVDTLFNETGASLKPGTPSFIEFWEESLNEDKDETYQIFFG